MTTAATIISREDLPRDGNTFNFEGRHYGDTDVSFIWVEMPPGDGPRLHRHAYAEIIIVQEGRATFTVGETGCEVQAGHVVIIPAGTPHAFFNSGSGPLRQIDLHLSRMILTEWLV